MHLAATRLGCRSRNIVEHLAISKRKATNLTISALSWQGVAYIFKC